MILASPFHGKILSPGGGCFSSFIEHALDKRSLNSKSGIYKGVTAGKPSKLLFKSVEAAINETYGKQKVLPEELIMVGDRMNTDMFFGNSVGMKTILVLSGVSSEEALKIQITKEKNEPNFIPKFYAKSMGSFPID